MNYWLVKQEPEDYAWAAFVKDGRATWTGVRNFQARNNLRAMRADDAVLYYHSGVAKEIVGVARVAKEAFPDPTATEGDWSAVELSPIKAVTTPLSLAVIKGDEVLKAMALIRQPRLSVLPVTKAQYVRVLRLSGTRL